MEGYPYQKFFISRRKGSDPETEPGKLHSGEPGFLLAGILGTGVPSSGDPEAGVLPRVWRNSIPEYFSPTLNVPPAKSQGTIPRRGKKLQLLGSFRLNSSIFGNMEGYPYQKFFISRRKGSDPETEPGKLHSGEPGFLLAGILGTGVPSSGDPEAGVLPRVWRNSIPEYFSPTLNVPPAKSQGTIPRRGKKLQLQHQNLKEHQVLLNLLIPLILSLAKILPLRILGSMIRIWGMSRNITLYAYVRGFSIKLSANSDQFPPWGQRLILIKEKKKVLQAQLDPAVTSCPLGSLTNTLPDLDHVFVSNQGLFPILQAIYLQSGCKSFQTDRKYIRALSTREFDGPGYEPTSYSKFNKEFDTMVLGSCPQVLGSYPPGVGPCLRVLVLPPASRPSDLSCLRINGNLPLTRFLNLKKGVREIHDQSSQFHSRQGKVPYLEDLLLRHAYDRLTPAVTTDKGKIYTHCSTSTTLLTGSGHDLQLISRVPPCSLKHTETSCSLQHIDRSTICSSHAPLRTDNSYPLQSYVLPRLRAH
ncbi:hypothetical protein DY000_02042185 [Brassica cretica]|uniref:Uncharacterized protein n=1 Tax=Brassica cretica TaxID=69181 RepID=A0ABQ7BAF3_BRACR|nr:hypothetical protein DY000_02042185 [Brassica cretica]